MFSQGAYFGWSHLEFFKESFILGSKCKIYFWNENWNLPFGVILNGTLNLVNSDWIQTVLLYSEIYSWCLNFPSYQKLFSLLIFLLVFFFKLTCSNHFWSLFAFNLHCIFLELSWLFFVFMMLQNCCWNAAGQLMYFKYLLIYKTFILHFLFPFPLCFGLTSPWIYVYVLHSGLYHTCCKGFPSVPTNCCMVRKVS